MRLAAFMVVKDAASYMSRALQGLLNTSYFDGVYVSVDSRTSDGTREWLALLEHGWCGFLTWGEYEFSFETGFSGAYNGAMDMALDLFDSQWAFQLDADEMIDTAQASQLRRLLDHYDSRGATSINAPRHNWLDWQRSAERSDLWPDRQTRFFKRGVRNQWRVHPTLEGDSYNMGMTAAEFTIHHFAYALRPDQAAWEATNQFYAELLERDIAAGRVWP